VWWNYYDGFYLSTIIISVMVLGMLIYFRVSQPVSLWLSIYSGMHTGGGRDGVKWIEFSSRPYCEYMQYYKKCPCLFSNINLILKQFSYSQMCLPFGICVQGKVEPYLMTEYLCIKNYNVLYNIRCIRFSPTLSEE